MRATPRLLSSLDIADGEIIHVRFGQRSIPVLFQAAQEIAPDGLQASRVVSISLALVSDLDCTVWRSGPREISIGPLIGLMISRPKLQSIIRGKRDQVYCRYAAYAREAGAVLAFFAPPVPSRSNATIQAFLYECSGGGPGQWRPVTIPLPAVVYDRAFGAAGRAAAEQFRRTWGDKGTVVVNRPVKITKMMAFSALGSCEELAAHLPFTQSLTPEVLASAMERYDDLYLKPNALSKGKGVLRLTRSNSGWLLQGRSNAGNLVTSFPSEEAVQRELAATLSEKYQYVLQEGLALSRYLGNRFDFRSLVQKDGQGRWRVTGLVARIAPEGSAITSPRSGGQTATPEQALEHAFGDRYPEVLAEIHRVSLAIAERIDERLGPCAELGLDLGVIEDGAVKLIEVNGIPLRVSLERLRDPLVSERINRFPIHYAASLDAKGAGQLQDDDSDRVPPLVGVMLGPSDMRLLQRTMHFRPLATAAADAGVRHILFAADDVDTENLRVKGWELRDDQWVLTDAPLPEVVYNRATHAARSKRIAARGTVAWLTEVQRVNLVNCVNSFSKMAVHEALRFFPETADLTPETVRLRSEPDLRGMLERHPVVYAKSDHGSHGSDVVRIRPADGGWEVRGRIRGRRVQERFFTLQSLMNFFTLLLGNEAWVLQQGITLPEAKGRIVDLRVVVQKDGEGRWAVPLVMVRRAHPDSVAANISQGGERLLSEEFLEQFGAELPMLKGMKETASAVSVKVAWALESRVGRLGEVGVDVGIDQCGRAWVFEANTKPLHSRFPSLPEDHLVRLPLQYAAFLARRARAGCHTGLPMPSPL